VAGAVAAVEEATADAFGFAAGAEQPTTANMMAPRNAGAVAATVLLRLTLVTSVDCPE
jgi:hypothetical protein